MSDRSKEIENFMLTTFSSEGIEDTPENRLAFLQGMQTIVNEPDPEDATLTTEQSFEKSLYKLALWGMIFNLQTRIRFNMTQEVTS